MNLMKTTLIVAVVAAVSAVAGCGGSDGAMGGGGSPPPVVTTPPPAPKVFTNAVLEQVIGNDANSNTTAPIEVETTEFAFTDDDNPAAFDAVIASAP